MSDGECQPSETIAYETAAASPAPAAITVGRTRAGAASAAQSASVSAAVAWPLGKLPGFSVPSSSTTFSTCVAAPVASSSTGIAIAIR